MECTLVNEVGRAKGLNYFFYPTNFINLFKTKYNTSLSMARQGVQWKVQRYANNVKTNRDRVINN